MKQSMARDSAKEAPLKSDKITQLQNRLAQQYQSLFRSWTFQSEAARCWQRNSGKLPNEGLQNSN
jgi:hypothetical protein